MARRISRARRSALITLAIAVVLGVGFGIGVVAMTQRALAERAAGAGDVISARFAPTQHHAGCGATPVGDPQRTGSSVCRPYWTGDVLRGEEVLARGIPFDGATLDGYGITVPRANDDGSTPFAIDALWVTGTRTAYPADASFAWWKPALLGLGFALALALCVLVAISSLGQVRGRSE